MMGDSETDALLRERFAQLEAEDARRAPDFAAMMAQARGTIGRAAQDDPAAPSPRTRDVLPVANRRVVLRWAIPVAIAAGLAGIMLLPRRSADQEFDRLVTEWSRTSDATRHAPTDGLLARPGIGLLGGMSPVGSGVGAIRGPS
jgi:hypothetical protein